MLQSTTPLTPEQRKALTNAVASYQKANKVFTIIGFISAIAFLFLGMCTAIGVTWSGEASAVFIPYYQYFTEDPYEEEAFGSLLSAILFIACLLCLVIFCIIFIKSEKNKDDAKLQSLCKKFLIITSIALILLFICSFPCMLAICEYIDRETYAVSFPLNFLLIFPVGSFLATILMEKKFIAPIQESLKNR